MQLFKRPSSILKHDSFMSRRLFLETFLTCAVLLPGAQSFAWCARAEELTPPTALQGCPIPLQVTLKFESSEPPAATSRGKNIYTVTRTATLPQGVSTISSHEVTVVDQLGSATVTIPGYFKATTVAVEHTRSTPVTSITPFASVESLANTRPCDTTRTYTGGTGTPVNASPASARSVPLASTQSPRVVDKRKEVKIACCGGSLRSTKAEASSANQPGANCGCCQRDKLYSSLLTL